MRSSKILLPVLALFPVFSLTSCSEKEEVSFPNAVETIGDLYGKQIDSIEGDIFDNPSIGICHFSILSKEKKESFLNELSKIPVTYDKSKTECCKALDECQQDDPVSLLRNASITLSFKEGEIVLRNMCSLALGVSIGEDDRELYFYGESPALLSFLQETFKEKIPVYSLSDGSLRYLRPIHYQDEDILIEGDKKTSVNHNAVFPLSGDIDFSSYTVYEGEEVIDEIPEEGYHCLYLEDGNGNLFEYEYENTFDVDEAVKEAAEIFVWAQKESGIEAWKDQGLIAVRTLYDLEGKETAYCFDYSNGETRTYLIVTDPNGTGNYIVNEATADSPSPYYGLGEDEECLYLGLFGYYKRIPGNDKEIYDLRRETAVEIGSLREDR